MLVVVLSALGNQSIALTEFAAKIRDLVVASHTLNSDTMRLINSAKHLWKTDVSFRISESIINRFALKQIRIASPNFALKSIFETLESNVQDSPYSNQLYVHLVYEISGFIERIRTLEHSFNLYIDFETKKMEWAEASTALKQFYYNFATHFSKLEVITGNDSAKIEDCSIRLHNFFLLRNELLGLYKRRAEYSSKDELLSALEHNEIISENLKKSISSRLDISVEVHGLVEGIGTAVVNFVCLTNDCINEELKEIDAAMSRMKVTMSLFPLLNESEKNLKDVDDSNTPSSFMLKKLRKVLKEDPKVLSSLYGLLFLNVHLSGILNNSFFPKGHITRLKELMNELELFLKIIGTPLTFNQHLAIYGSFLTDALTSNGHDLDQVSIYWNRLTAARADGNLTDIDVIVSGAQVAYSDDLVERIWRLLTHMATYAYNWQKHHESSQG